MQFGELDIRDQFRTEAVPNVRFRKAPNGMGECVEDPLKSQFFHDAAPVTLVKKGRESPADESPTVNQNGPGADEAGNPATEGDDVKSPEGTDADAGKRDKGKK